MSISGLDIPVLVLDKNYTPISIVSGKLAITLMFSNKALILDSSYTAYTLEEWISYCKLGTVSNLPVIRSSNVNFIVPEVIVIPNYVRSVNTRKVKYSRNSVFKRDNHTCQYCGKNFRTSELTVDHVVPKSKGGKSTWLNIVSACKPCNSQKGDRLLKDANMKILNPPKIPSWKDSAVVPYGLTRNMWNSFM